MMNMGLTMGIGIGMTPMGPMAGMFIGGQMGQRHPQMHGGFGRHGSCPRCGHHRGPHGPRGPRGRRGKMMRKMQRMMKKMMRMMQKMMGMGGGCQGMGGMMGGGCCGGAAAFGFAGMQMF